MSGAPSSFQRTTARIALLLAIVVLVAVVGGCSNDPSGSTTASATASTTAQARPVTTTESQLLATVRFNNFDAGSRPFRTEITEKGTALHLQGWIDYGSHLGYAAVTGSFQPQALIWNGRSVGVHQSAPDANGNPALPILDPADTAWVSHPPNPTSSRLDALLQTIGGLGSDRPDNPVLVQQAGALWLRTDSVDGTPVTVFASPPSDMPVRRRQSDHRRHVVVAVVGG